MKKVISLIEETIEGMNKNEFNFTKNGECSNCGRCCSNLLPMSEYDIRRIKRYIKKNNIKACSVSLPIAKGYEDIICPFRDEEKKICTIYPARPFVCREFICDKNLRNQSPLRRQFKIVFAREEFFGGMHERDNKEKDKMRNI